MNSNAWDERYRTAGYVYGTEPNAFLASVAHHIPAGPVLCLAEGEGRNGVFLAQAGHTVMAVDGSHNGLLKAQALAASKGVAISTRTIDLAEYSIEANAWSGIVAIWAHLPPPLRRRVHAEAVHGLVPGGVFVVEAYTPAQIAFGTGGPKDPALCMTLAGLRQELAGLEFLIGRELERDVLEGTGHTGRASVVQVLAQRPFA